MLPLGTFDFTKKTKQNKNMKTNFTATSLPSIEITITRLSKIVSRAVPTYALLRVSIMSAV